VQLLSGRLGRTLAQLSSELGVSKRTVQRDIGVLEAAGFPVTSEMRNGTVFWHFMEGFHAEAPVALTLTEQMALYFSKGLFRPLQGTPIYGSLESAIEKIGSQLPPQSFGFLRGLGQGISVSSFGLKDYSCSKRVIEALTRAVFNRLTARIAHRAVHQERAIEREVDPYRLWYVNNGLYLVAYDHLKSDLRVFAIEGAQGTAPNPWIEERARLHDLVPLSQAAGRPEPRPGGRRDGAADAWGATMRPSASSGGPRCHRLGPGSGEHVVCGTPAPLRAKSPALAALAEVDGRGGSGSADSPLAARAAVHGTTVGLCPPGWKRLPTRRASGWCWPMPNSTARGITLISAGSSGPGM
jgi:hypothetical protein